MDFDALKASVSPLACEMKIEVYELRRFNKPQIWVDEDERVGAVDVGLALVEDEVFAVFFEYFVEFEWVGDFFEGVWVLGDFLERDEIVGSESEFV